MQHRPKVLIVEDSGFFRRALALNLSQAGFEVFSAANGEDAVDTAQREKPHAIVLDMFMPKLNGVMVLRVLRSHAETKLIPVILLSANSKEEDVVQARTLGAVEYVSKNSMDFDDLVHLIQVHGSRYMLQQDFHPHAAPVPMLETTTPEGKIQ